MVETLAGCVAVVGIENNTIVLCIHKGTRRSVLDESSSCRTAAFNLLWGLYIANGKQNGPLREYHTCMFMYVPYPFSFMRLYMVSFKITYSARRKMKEKLEENKSTILILAGSMRKTVGWGCFKVSPFFFFKFFPANNIVLVNIVLNLYIGMCLSIGIFFQLESSWVKVHTY